MIELESFGVKNALLWKHVDFYLQTGVSLVTGQNRSGKTLLFRLLSQSLWGASFAKRGTELSKLPENSSVTVNLQVRDTSWNIKATPSKFQLEKNGRSLELPGKNAALDRLRKLIPITKELYDSTVHVSGAHPSLLSILNPQQRLDWLLSAFNLNETYDALLKKVQSELAQSKKASIEISILEPELLAAKKSLGKLKDGGHVDLKKKLKLLQEALSVDRERLASLNAATSLFREVTTLPKTTVTTKSIRRLEKKLAIRVAYEKELAVYESKLQDYKRNIEASSEARRTVKAASKRLNRLELKDFSKETVRVLRALKDKYENDYSRWSEEQASREKWLNHSLYGQPMPSIEKAQKHQARTEAELREIDKRLSASNVEGECPTCGTAIDAHEHESHLEQLRLRRKALRNKLQIQNTIVSAVQLSESITIHDDPSKDFKRAKHALDLVEDYFSLLNRKKEAESVLKSLPEAVKPKSTKCSVSASSVEITDRLSKMRQDREGSNKRKTLKKQLKKQLSTLNVPTSKLYDEINKLSSRISESSLKETTLGARVLEVEAALVKIETVSKRLEALKKDTRDEDVLSELAVAFGKKGLRVDLAKDIVEALQEELNSLITIMWPDRAYFDLSIVDNGLKIVFFRRNLSSDLSTLSGSESNVWKMILALALVRLLPSDKRLDFIILDELEAMLDDKTRNVFAREFLPEMAKTIPKVIVVSPQTKSSLPIAAIATYSVKSKGKVSTLEKLT